MEAFGESLHFDRRLGAVDIRASIAHARMLGSRGIIAKKDSNAIIRGLKSIKKEMDDGTFPFDPRLEDIHMNIEARLIDLIGPTGGKLHTGRSRNDQVAVDLRLWLRDEIRRAAEEIKGLINQTVEQARKHAATVMPGYTHLQHAQPVTFGHHLLAYVSMFERDIERFKGCAKRVNIMPLGAGALAGGTLPLDPESVAEELDFDDVFTNSMDAVSDRDFAAEFLFCAALCQIHLSRMAEELILWSSTEFDFVELPEEYTTGSSIMPQKRNPDSAELTRGKTGRMIGNLTAVLTLLKGLPLAYNRDLQEDKEPVFDASDTLRASLRVITGVMKGLKVNKASMRDALKDGFIEATDLAEYLVRKGMPFREAHEVVGELVLAASSKGVALGELDFETYRSASKLFEKDVFDSLDIDKSISRRKTRGGPGTVNKQLRKYVRRKKK